MGWRHPISLPCLALPLCLACGEPTPEAAPRGEPPSIAAPRSGIRFDPGTLRPGDRVGALVLDSIAARRTVIDSSWVGLARFRGALELSGATFRHPDPEAQAVCFEADAESAVRLPRWAGDERRPWFCFENPAAAAQALGGPSDGIRATVVVDRFTIHRGLTDEVNSARFVRLVRGGAPVRPDS